MAKISRGFISGLLLFFIVFPAYSGVIVLKNGEEISGQIIKKTGDVVKIKVGSEIRVYKRENIESIKGRKPFLVKTEIIPQSSEEFFVAGVGFAAKRHFLLARDNFTKASELDPKNESIQQALNIIDGVGEGKIESDFALYLFQAADYFINQEYQKSIEAGRKALKINPDAAEIYGFLGVSYYTAGQPDRGKATLEKAKKIFEQEGDLVAAKEMDELLQNLP